MGKLTLTAIALSVAVVFAVFAFTVSLSRLHNKELDDVREVAMRSSLDPNTTAYVKIEKSEDHSLLGRLVRRFFHRSSNISYPDPDPAFLERIKDLYIRFKPASITKNVFNGIVDTSTNKYVSVCEVGCPKKVAENSYTVYVEMNNNAGFGSSGSDYNIVRHSGRWEVVWPIKSWISSNDYHSRNQYASLLVTTFQTDRAGSNSTTSGNLADFVPRRVISAWPITSAMAQHTTRQLN